MSRHKTLLAGLSILAATLTSRMSSAQDSATGGDSKAEASKAAAADTAAAQTAAPKTAAPRTPTMKAAPDQIRRDPNGLTGISPFWEAVIEGDNAYVAGSYPAALEAYKKALAAEPTNAKGHYRVGQVQVATGQLEEAEKAYETALKYAENDPPTKAKILFVLADLRERQKDNEGATERWDAYASHTAATKTGHPATAVERKKVIATWQQLQEQYAAVKERIVQREKEAQETLEKGAK